MSWLSNLFGMGDKKSNRKKTHSKKSHDSKKSKEQPSLSFTFLFDELPKITDAKLTQSLRRRDIDLPIAFENTLGDEEAGVLYGEIALGKHRFKIIGFDRSLPESVASQCIECSHWSQDQKQSLREHKAHILVYYEGGAQDATRQMVAMFQLAGAFLDFGLLGSLDPEAWTSTPRSLLEQNFENDTLAKSARLVPLALWTGFMKFFMANGDVWFFTKAFPRWGVPDFAMKAPHAEAEDILTLFMNLFHYVLEGAQLTRGDTVQFGDLYLRCGPVTEYTEEIGEETLVLEKIDSSQINPRRK